MTMSPEARYLGSFKETMSPYLHKQLEKARWKITSISLVLVWFPRVCVAWRVGSLRSGKVHDRYQALQMVKASMDSFLNAY